MSYMLVDDQMFQNRKFKALMRRGLEGDADAWGAGLLWVMAGSSIKAAFGDGVLTTYELFQIVPDPRAAPRLARVLVDAGLWHDAEHVCGRCERPGPDQYAFHDWRVYHRRSGEEERNARALTAERNDPQLKEEVWRRDRLSGRAPGVPDEALCAYCRGPVSRATKTGALAPEVDHVIPRALGVDNMVISHRRCNRVKGRRTPAAAGLALHLTDAHRAALELRERCSPPDGAAGLLRAMFERDPWPLDGQGALFDDVPRPPAPPQAGTDAGRDGGGSHPHGSAEPTDAVGDAPAPDGPRAPAPRPPARSALAAASAGALTGARGPAWHGTARQGAAPAGDGAAPRGRRRRRRRRARKKPGSPTVCPIHGDRLPCRLCEEEVR